MFRGAETSTLVSLALAVSLLVWSLLRLAVGQATGVSGAVFVDSRQHDFFALAVRGGLDEIR